MGDAGVDTPLTIYENVRIIISLVGNVSMYHVNGDNVGCATCDANWGNSSAHTRKLIKPVYQSSSESLANRVNQLG